MLKIVPVKRMNTTVRINIGKTTTRSLMSLPNTTNGSSRRKQRKSQAAMSSRKTMREVGCNRRLRKRMMRRMIVQFISKKQMLVLQRDIASLKLVGRLNDWKLKKSFHGRRVVSSGDNGGVVIVPQVVMGVLPCFGLVWMQMTSSIIRRHFCLLFVSL